jgi:hypothetical protein
MPGNRFAPTPPYALAPENETGAARERSAVRAEGGGGAPAAAAPGGGVEGTPGGARNVAPAAAPDPPESAPAPSSPAESATADNASPANRPVTRRSAPPEPKNLPDKNVPDKGFPETWRQDLAGGDKAFRKTLDRFDSPAALAKAYRELTARLSSGELRSTKPPSETATPSEAAAWRAEHGLPETAAAYVDGLQPGDRKVAGAAEKALLASFADQAMKGNWTAAQYNQAVGWYLDLQGRVAAQRDHADATFKNEASSDLMREWGHDYAANRNAVAQFFDRSFPEDFKEALLTARLSDGRMLANHPTFNKAILEVAKTINPSSTLLPNASGGGLSNVESRIAEIEGKYMRATHGSDSWKSYWTGEAGARMQQEYRGLLAAREGSRRGRAG